MFYDTQVIMLKPHYHYVWLEVLMGTQT